MPITVDADIRRPTQAEFGRVAYAVMGEVFRIHSEFGRLFDETVYQNELAARVPDSRIEVPIEITFGDFKTVYYIDLLVAAGAVFELKTVETPHKRHRGQLLNYLLLTDLPHGKLINFRSESVEHEFVNTRLRHRDRTAFQTTQRDWIDHRNMHLLTIELLRDWGTGLDSNLYRDALTHFLGGEERVVRNVPVTADGTHVASQRVSLVAPRVAFTISSFAPDRLEKHEQHLRRFLNHTELDAFQWINITREMVTFTTIEKNGQKDLRTEK